jgi:Tfp pilus assembly protein PilV
MRRTKHNERGFTVLETCIALGVMLVVGLGATSLVFYAVRFNSGAADRTMEMAILQQQMELYRSVPWNSAQLAAQPKTTTVFTTTPSSAGQVSTQYGVAGGTTTGTAGDSRSYNLDTTIEDVTTYVGGPVMQKRITLTVTPRNTANTRDWRGQAPMTVVIRRSSPALGPYRL